MIKIDLLPKEFKKRKVHLYSPNVKLLQSFTLRTWLIVGGSGVGFVLVMALFLILILPKANLQSKLKKLDKRQTVIKEDVEQALMLKKRENILEKKVKSLVSFEKGRILWAPLLNDISNCTPRDLQLSRLYIKEEKQELGPKKRKKKKKKSKKKKEKKKKSEKKVFKTLVLEGILAGKKNEAVVNQFIENLRKAPYFSKVFTDISLSSIMVQDRGRKRFKVTCIMGKS